jgi:hypothetical protein
MWVGAVRPGRAQTPPPDKDVLVLNNGDRLTGEIKGLSRGKLSFDMDSTGIVSLKWDRVISVTTTNLFEVETATGERLLGTLSVAGKGKLTVVGQAGVAAREFDIQAIVGLAPIKRSFFSRLDGAIDLGGSYTQSSGVAQIYVDYWTTTRHPSFEIRVAFEDYVTFKSDGATSEQLNGSLGYARYLSGRWAIFGVGQVERNPDLGFNLRGTLAGGLQWTLVQSNRSELVAGAGLGGSREKPVEGETETQIPALLALRYSLFIYDSPKTTLDTTFNAYPILNQSGRWRLRADGSVKRELFEDFSVGFTVYESFDSSPPSAGAKRNDVGTTLSIGYTF